MIARAPAGPQGLCGTGDGAKRYWMGAGRGSPRLCYIFNKGGPKKAQHGPVRRCGIWVAWAFDKLHKVYHRSCGNARGNRRENMKFFREKYGILHRFDRHPLSPAEKAAAPGGAAAGRGAGRAQKYFLTPSGARDSSSLMVMVNLMLCCSPKLFSQSRNFSVSLSHWPPTILVRLSIKMWVMS